MLLWVALHVQNNGVIYFDSFGVEHIPKESKTFAGKKNHKNKFFYNTSICFNNVPIFLIY